MWLTCSLCTGYLVKRAVGHIIDIFQHACVTASVTACSSSATSASADGVLASANAALPLSFTLFIPEHIWIGVLIICTFLHVVDTLRLWFVFANSCFQVQASVIDRDARIRTLGLQQRYVCK